MKNLLYLNPRNRFTYAFKYTTFTFLITVILSILISKITSEWTNGEEFLYIFFFVIINIITGLILIRYYFKLNFTWSNYNKMGIVMSILLSFYFVTSATFVNNRKDSLIDLLFPFLISLLFFFIISSITGIFLEKSSYKVKFKRLLSVILFIWAIYKIITSFTSKDDESTYGIDTDGDGVKDSFDTDGDGLIDTVYTDRDGDGVLDTVSMDTDGDGLVDTVASDLSGDGKIDTILKDTNRDGLVDVRLKDSDGDGKIDSLS